MTNKLERKWIILSALMHAVLLGGIGLSARPATSPAPAHMTVSLVSFPMETSPTNTFRRYGASSLTPASPPAGALVELENTRRSEPASGYVETAGPKPSEHSVEKHLAEVKETPEPVLEWNGKTASQEPAAEQDDRIRSAPTTKGRAAGVVTGNLEQTASPVSAGGPELQLQAPNLNSLDALSPAQDRFQTLKLSNPQTRLLAFSGTANWVQEGSPVFAGGFASQLQTSDFKLQTRFSASSGYPSSFGEIFGTVHEAVFARAELLDLPEPAYPVASRKRGEEGTVIVEVRVNAQGGVKGAQVAASSTYPRLDQAALDAARSGRFSPATVDGRRVESERTVAYTFRLE